MAGKRQHPSPDARDGYGSNKGPKPPTGKARSPHVTAPGSTAVLRQSKTVDDTATEAAPPWADTGRTER